MERLVSSWSNGKTLPESYVFPPTKRPGNHQHLASSSSNTLPVIDLGCALLAHRRDCTAIVEQILDAAQHFGFFQVINHGVASELIDDVRVVFNEFFNLPTKEKESFCNGDFDDKCVLYTSNIEYHNEELHLWRDALKHSCTPLEECMQYWPHKPIRYREVVGEYVINMTKLGAKISELICLGLGLEKDYFDKKSISHESILLYYRYPPCPDPTLTFGIAKHCDPNLITILLQDDVLGLQVLKDGEWISVEPIPYAFVVNVGHQLQIVSNGKLKSVDHRVVTNADKTRTSVAFFITPTKDCLVQPAQSLVSVENPALYKAVRYEDFFETFKVASRLKSDHVLENFLLTPSDST